MNDSAAAPERLQRASEWDAYYLRKAEPNEPGDPMSSLNFMKTDSKLSNVLLLEQFSLR